MNTEKLLTYENRKANKKDIWIFFLFFGWSYGSLGQTGKQILFYLTFGGVGIWAFVRMFTLNSAIKKYNRDLANKVGLSLQEINALNLN